MSESRLISEIVSKQISMQPSTSQQEIQYNSATVCSNCHKTFTLQNPKVTHDDHISGLYLFAACNSCNLQLKPIKFQCRTTGDKRKFSPKFEQAATGRTRDFLLFIWVPRSVDPITLTCSYSKRKGQLSDITLSFGTWFDWFLTGRNRMERHLSATHVSMHLQRKLHSTIIFRFAISMHHNRSSTPILKMWTIAHWSSQQTVSNIPYRFTSSVI